jgi:putative hemolysin
LLKNLDHTVSTLLVVTSSLNTAAAVLTTLLALRFAEQLDYPIIPTAIVANAFLVLVILLFGRLGPRSIAVVFNQRIAMLSAPIVTALTIVLAPLVFLFMGINRLLFFLITGRRKRASELSESTVIGVVEKGKELGVIKESEKTLIQNVFLFDEREVYSIMTPRTAVFALKDTLTLRESKEVLIKRLFTRIPVFSDSIDNITGILNLKTAFKNLLAGRHDAVLKELAQKPLYVYETLSLSTLLEKFKSEQNHMAIVIDEFGGMAGIVTLEDVLEELVGEIYDEKDEVSSLIRQVGENTWNINGKTDILTTNKYINGDIPIEGDFETLQGLIMSHLGRLPVVGDTLTVKAHRLTVRKMKQNEILSVVVEYTPPDGTEEIAASAK